MPRASLSCRNSGSFASRPIMSRIQARVPTLPTPTTFRAECRYEARHQPFHVPFERARQRLVEVVDAEHQPPIGCCETAEVGQVRIPAELHVKPGPRRAGQVGRHRVGRPAEERERRDQDPPVADRHQLAHARSGLLLEQLDRITPIRGRFPLTVRGPRRYLPCRLAARGPLRDREVGCCLCLLCRRSRSAEDGKTVSGSASVGSRRSCVPTAPRACTGVLNVRHHVAPFAPGRNVGCPPCDVGPWNRATAAASSPKRHESPLVVPFGRFRDRSSAPASPRSDPAARRDHRSERRPVPRRHDLPELPHLRAHALRV